MRGRHFRERLLGLATADHQSLQVQEQLHIYPDWELSEEDVWGGCDGAAMSMDYEDGGSHVQDMEASRNCRSGARSGSSLSLAGEEHEGATPAIEIPYSEESSGVELSVGAAGGRARGSRADARSLNAMIRKKAAGGYGDVDDDDDEEEDEYDRGNGHPTPPHLMITARQRAGMSSSVMEGAGRTLKGRDLRNVRNAVWKHTGFFR